MADDNEKKLGEYMERLRRGADAVERALNELNDTITEAGLFVADSDSGINDIKKLFEGQPEIMITQDEVIHIDIGDRAEVVSYILWIEGQYFMMNIRKQLLEILS